MIQLSGLEVRDDAHLDGDVDLVYTGLRPGKKLYGELLIGENVSGTEHHLIMRAEEHELSWPALKTALKKIDTASHQFEFESVRNVLKEVVDGYKPQGKICDHIYSTGCRPAIEAH